MRVLSSPVLLALGLGTFLVIRWQRPCPWIGSVPAASSARCGVLGPALLMPGRIRAGLACVAACLHQPLAATADVSYLSIAAV